MNNTPLHNRLQAKIKPNVSVSNFRKFVPRTIITPVPIQRTVVQRLPSTTPKAIEQRAISLIRPKTPIIHTKQLVPLSKSSQVAQQLKTKSIDEIKRNIVQNTNSSKSTNI